MHGSPPRKFNPHPFPYHAEFELDITSLTNMGQGVGRMAGWVVMAPFVLPGEKVRVRVYRNHANYSDADLVEVLEPSPDRVEPVCPLFGTCGGCQYQHLRHEIELEWKGRQIGELLERMAGVAAKVDPVIPSPRAYGYRSKLTPHFSLPRKGRELAIGFLRVGSRNALIDVPQCPIATEGINRALPELREDVRRRISSYKRGATLLLRDSPGGVLTSSDAVASERVGDLVFRFPAGDFFQNNPFLLERLAAHVADEASAGGGRHLVDAYCGSGFFALTAASRFDSVAGVEVSERAIDWARRNAEANGIGNCRFQAGDAASIFGGIDFGGGESAVVVDPPRKGCGRDFLDQLFAFGPGRVVYVSCNPATQMRDLTRFRESGYALLRVQPFDLFPRTKHVECVMTLARAAT